MNIASRLQERYKSVPDGLSPFQVMTNDVPLIRSARPFKMVQTDSSDKANNIFTFLITTASLDRYNDSVNPMGGVFEHYLNNPVVLWNHDSWMERPVGKSLELKPSEEGVLSKCQFHGLTQVGKEVLDLVAGGFLHTTSVGFIPLELTMRMANEGEKLYPSWTGNEVCVYDKWELLEYSIVNIPANPTAVIQNSFYDSIRKALDTGTLTNDSALIRNLAEKNIQITRNNITVMKDKKRIIKRVQKQLTPEQMDTLIVMVTPSVETFIKETLVNELSIEVTVAETVAKEYASAGEEVLMEQLGTAQEDSSTDESTTEETASQASYRRVKTKAGNRNNATDQERINDIARLASELGATNITLNEEPPSDTEEMSVDAFLKTIKP